MFYILCSSLDERSDLIEWMRVAQMNPVFHYLSLHKSPFYASKYAGPDLPHTERYTNCLLRLPLFFELKDEQVHEISNAIHAFYSKR